MRYFSGTLSRDGRTLGDVIGEIRRERKGFDGCSISRYVGAMDPQGWKPSREDGGPGLRLVADQGFAMDVILSWVSSHPDGSIFPPVIRLDGGEPCWSFVGVGEPVAMPADRSLVPAGG